MPSAIATHHLPGYLQSAESAEVVAIAEVHPESAHSFAQTVGNVEIFADYRDMVASPDIDAVDICLPHHLHKDAVIAAAAAGKHILCEKPLCLSLAQADEITRAVEKSGVTLMCAHNQLFDPSIRRARQMLDEGLLGRVYEIRTVDAFRLSMKADLLWRSKKETMGGGELIDTGYHPSYMLLYLAAGEPVEVTAMLSKYVIVSMEGEDSAQVLVRFADGAVGNIVTSWAYDLPVGAWQFQVIGERGQIYGIDNRLYYKLHDVEPTALALPEVNNVHAETAHFVACLRDGRAPIQTHVHGIDVLKLILAAYQSEAEKRTVELTRGG